MEVIGVGDRFRRLVRKAQVTIAAPAVCHPTSRLRSRTFGAGVCAQWLHLSARPWWAAGEGGAACAGCISSAAIRRRIR
jgi:hypothetical protein